MYYTGAARVQYKCRYIRNAYMYILNARPALSGDE